MSRLSKHRYGWKRDIPCPEDYLYHKHIMGIEAPVVLPPVVDLRASPCMPVVYDQLQSNSCTSNAAAAADQFLQSKLNPLKSFMPSRLFIYWNTRDSEGDANQDAGASIRDTVKAMSRFGVCPEAATLPGCWAFDETKICVKPDTTCYAEAIKHQVISYYSIKQTLNDLKTCLAAGYPIIYGATLYSSFESDAVAQSGIVPMPDTANEQMLGGHAMTIVGFIDADRVFIGRNSWNTSWGQKGYYTIPYDYVSSPTLACDFWTIRNIEVDSAAEYRAAKVR